MASFASSATTGGACKHAWTKIQAYSSMFKHFQANPDTWKLLYQPTRFYFLPSPADPISFPHRLTSLVSSIFKHIQAYLSTFMIIHAYSCTFKHLQANLGTSVVLGSCNPDIWVVTLTRELWPWLETWEMLANSWRCMKINENYQKCWETLKYTSSQFI